MLRGGNPPSYETAVNSVDYNSRANMFDSAAGGSSINVPTGNGTASPRRSPKQFASNTGSRYVPEEGMSVMADRLKSVQGVKVRVCVCC